MKNLFDLSDDLDLMTRGTGTIGPAYGEALLNAEARLVIWSRGETVPLEEKTGTRGRTFAFPVDVSDKEPTQVVARYWIANKNPGAIINLASMTSFMPLS